MEVSMWKATYLNDPRTASREKPNSPVMQRTLFVLDLSEQQGSVSALFLSLEEPSQLLLALVMCEPANTTALSFQS